MRCVGVSVWCVVPSPVFPERDNWDVDAKCTERGIKSKQPRRPSQGTRLRVTMMQQEPNKGGCFFLTTQSVMARPAQNLAVVSRRRGVSIIKGARASAGWRPIGRPSVLPAPCRAVCEARDRTLICCGGFPLLFFWRL